MPRLPLCWLVIVQLLDWTYSAHAADARPSAKPSVDFTRDVKPILSNYCFACHGPDPAKRKAGLRLDRREDAIRQRKSGAVAIIPGASSRSALIQRVTSDDDGERMPPERLDKRLSKSQIETLGRWIDEGARWEEHWSFVKPVRPPLPRVQNAAWPRNAIDHFILAKLEAKGLAPSAEADRATLLRRISLDLVGLPPTPEELNTFLADPSPNAYEKRVDQLLASPHYGERMAQQWLDLARYADTSGYHTDRVRCMWKYRDWVIDAFNQDKPFDVFTVEQLAGDLLPHPTLSQRVATGFNRNNMVNDEAGALAAEYLPKCVADRVETTSSVWLGLTMGCALCHDHKYDPLTQKEFYELYAFFNNVPEKGLVGGNRNTEPTIQVPSEDQQLRLDGLRKQIAKLDADWFGPDARADAEQELWEQKTRARLARHWSAVIASRPSAFSALAAAVSSDPPYRIGALLNQPSEKRTEAARSALRAYFRGQWSPALKAKLDDLHRQEAALIEAIPDTMVMLEKPGLRETYVLLRGDFRVQGEKVTPGVPRSLPPLPEGMPANRFALARWLVGPDHPLTSRVTVNRYWQAYFGTGLVKTSDDFGTRGEYPSHPELLDWLATEFIARDWDTKTLQRLIVTSATYRQASNVTPRLREVDPENRLLGRGPRFRLHAEAIRDNALAVSGLLSRKMGGPGIFPYQPPGLWETAHEEKYIQSRGADQYRRGVYVYRKRAVPYPSLLAFDAPTREVCTCARPQTNTPLQALVLMNDPVYVEAARVLGQRVLKEGGATMAERLTYAFKLCTARAPTAREIAILAGTYERQRARFKKDVAAARELIGIGDKERPADVDDGELAAWTAVGNVLLNLDETITKR
jgi:hypothetical protein